METKHEELIMVILAQITENFELLIDIVQSYGRELTATQGKLVELFERIEELENKANNDDVSD